MQYSFVNYLKIFVTAVGMVSAALLAGCTAGKPPAANQAGQAAAYEPEVTPVNSAADDIFDGKRVMRTEEEWREILSEEQYYVLREEGTERAFTDEYDKHKETGSYRCAACGLKLFDSAAKYDSGTGWPSFWQPINAKNIVDKPEDGIGDDRIETECARCGSHLGHVFDDGPKPTGLRYCMNSLALKFEARN